MLSYRHAYHAGNHADVLKHAVLSLLIASFKQKDKPFIYLDTHAGGGIYDLGTAQAEKTGEWRQGIGKLWSKRDKLPLLVDYFQAIAAYNTDSTPLQYYPGSPAIAQALLRPQDKLCLLELHTNEVSILREQVGSDPRTTVHHRDGLEGLIALLPPTPRRGLVLIDPAYEVAADYQQVPKALAKALQRWPKGTYVIWYPLLAKRRDTSQTLLNALNRLPCKNLLVAELSIESQNPEFGMHGSGLAIINVPWQLDEQLQAVLPQLKQALQLSEYADWRVNWRIQAGDSPV